MILLYQRIKGYEGIMGTSRSREFRGRMREGGREMEQEMEQEFS